MSDTLTMAEILDLCAVTGADRADCRRLLDDPFSRSAEVAGVLDVLAARLGTFPSEPPTAGPSERPPAGPSERSTAGPSERAWIVGFLRFTPTLVRWQAEQGIPTDITRATLADLGRHLVQHRRAFGRFGLHTWWWLTGHWSGGLYQLGRLQFELRRKRIPIAGVLDAGDWFVGIHIPAIGPLSPQAVDASLAAAAVFFAQHFDDARQHQPVRVGTCRSWLLDPYLRQHLPDASNMARFADRFTSYEPPTDAPTDALWFTFGTRDLDRVAELPRDTRLQRVVLERIEAGERWQFGAGYLPLPGVRSGSVRIEGGR